MGGMEDENLVGGIEVAKEFIPRKTRRAIYASMALLGYLLGAAAVGFSAAGVQVPTALVIALSVSGFLLGPVAQLAAAHTPEDDQSP